MKVVQRHVAELGHTLVQGPILTINYDFCFKFSFVVSKVVVKFRYEVNYGHAE